jgi:uncharacterized membrane protein
MILLLAAGLRFYGIKSWDEGTRLHPDERFLSMVTSGMSWPALEDYFNYEKSSLNPHKSNNFFIYGTFPLLLVKAIGDLSGFAGYDREYLMGRALSAFFDVLTVLLVFLIGRRIFDTRTALAGAFFLAIAVIHIQHAHFFVVDLFATFFLTLSLYFLIRFAQQPLLRNALGAGIAWGIALACKISALLFAPVIAFAFLLAVAPVLLPIFKKKFRFRRRNVAFTALLTCGKLVLAGLVLLALAFACFRVLQPYAFTGPHVWDVGLSEGFVKSYNQQQGFNNPEARYPPVFQWRHRTPFFQLLNLGIWYLGIPLSILAIIGAIVIVRRAAIKRQWLLFLPLFWVILVVGFHATQHIKFTRYLLPITPVLALFAGLAAVTLFDRVRAIPARKKQVKCALFVLMVLLFLASSFWTLAFMHIYAERHSRIQASAWMYQNIPENATIAVEHWDDALPVGVPGVTRIPHYSQVVLALYGPDSEANKVQALSVTLSLADYVVMSSNRLSGTIPRIPEWYPITSHYYELLENGLLGYRPLQQFTSYPSLFGITIPDDTAEEAFSVYDHPQVRIFKNERHLSPAEIYRTLNATG